MLGRVPTLDKTRVIHAGQRCAYEQAERATPIVQDEGGPVWVGTLQYYTYRPPRPIGGALPERCGA